MDAIKSYQQLEEFIRLHKLVRWMVTYDKTDAGEKPSRLLLNAYKDAPLEENLEYTKNALQYSNGTRLFFKGWRTDTATTAPIYAEIYLAGNDQPYGMLPQQMQQMIGATPSTFDKDELIKQVKQEMQNEFDRRELERERKQIEEERKSLNEEKNSAMGLLAQYLAPVAQAMASKARVPITGIQTAGGTVEADAIRPTGSEETEPEIFTDEEAEKLESLLARLKAAEPEYMALLEKVVELAEAHDGTYTMARGILLNK